MSLTPKQRLKAVTSTIDHLTSVIPSSDRNDLLDVLSHILAASLKGKDPHFVASYMIHITKMIDGKFNT